MNGTEYDKYMLEIEKAYIIMESNKEDFYRYIANHIEELDFIDRMATQQDITKFKQNMYKKQNEEEFIESGHSILRILQNRYTQKFRISERRYSSTVESHIYSLSFRGTTLNIFQKLLQVIIIIGATSVPFVLNIQDISKIVPTVISITVAVAAALISYFKFGNLIIFYQQSARKMQHEHNLYTSKRKHYNNLSDGAALNLFMDKIDELRHEQDKFSLELAKSSQKQEQKIEELVKISKH